MELTLLLFVAGTLSRHTTQFDITTSSERVVSCSLRDAPAPSLNITSIVDEGFVPIDTSHGQPPAGSSYPEPIVPGPCLPAVGSSSSSSPSTAFIAALVGVLGALAVFVSRRRVEYGTISTVLSTKHKRGTADEQ